MAWNPLYDQWKSVHPNGQRGRWDYPLSVDTDSLLNAFRMREQAVSDYAFSVPTLQVVRAIVQIAPRIVELGAGTGYWAKLLTDAGANVVALDSLPVGTKNTYMKGQEIGRWFPVRHGTVADLVTHSDRALLLCWPPYEDSMARDALQVWTGGVLIFIGEGCGGCTATDAFFQSIEADFEEVENIDIPQWDGLHDYVQIHRRTGVAVKNRAIELEDA